VKTTPFNPAESARRPYHCPTVTVFPVMQEVTQTATYSGPDEFKGFRITPPTPTVSATDWLK
jgi:hypothetical protein